MTETQIEVTQADRDAWEIYGPKIFNREMTGPEALAAYRTNRTDATPVAWMYRNSEGHVCAQFVQGLMDLNHWTETPLYAGPPATDVAALVEAAKAVDLCFFDESYPECVDLRQALAPFTKGQNDE